MGAYLSEPIVHKVSCDEASGKQKLSYGASGMQGWRVSQEDAHNCILEFDEDTSLFAVYDGHGGHEVAAYCADHLPQFLKTVESYKQGDLIKALEEAYLEFDHLLTKENVVKVLHFIAGNKSKEAASEDDPDEMSDLYEEATMSIEELITRYGNRIREAASEQQKGNSGSSHNDFVKFCAKNRKLKKITAGDATPPSGNGGTDEPADEEKPAVNEEVENSAQEPTVKETNEADNNHADNEEKKPEVKSEQLEVSSESNGKIHNGSSNNHDVDHSKAPCINSSPPAIAIVSSKGKGVGKGLSNNIRKVVEKTPEEIEREKREAERIAKRQERKESLRNKSADELYRSMVTNDEEEDTDEDGDDEEDEDFDGETSSSSDDPAVEEDDEDEWEDQDDEGEEEEEEEEDPAEVAAKAKAFAMNLKEEPGSDSGCTAVLSLLRGNTLYVANAGDSRCVLSRQGRAIPLSADHKPEDEPERSRIERAGGVVTGDGRVNGGLNLSRAIGDHAYKQNTDLGPREQMITALPDVQSIELQEGDDFFVLACDGIWNSKTNQQVVDFIRPRLSQSMPLSKICEELFDECLAPNTMGDGTGCDNMTAIIVRLDRFLPDEATSTGQKRPLPLEDSTDESHQVAQDGEQAKRQRVDEEVAKKEDEVPAAETASS